MIRLAYKNDTIINMNQSTLNKRQDIILKFLNRNKTARISELISAIKEQYKTTSKITVNRDLSELIGLNFISPKGAGRNSYYQLSDTYQIQKPVDAHEYFLKDIDERDIKERFNFEIFSNLKNIFTDKEKDLLNDLNNQYLKRVAKLPKDIIKKEFERLTIELSWKSSKIEGNTYSLLETESLIKEGKKSKGHTKEEMVMILNHKKTLDYIRNGLKYFQKISVRHIEEIHSILVDDLGVAKNIRNSLVGITGTRYRPLDNKFQIAEAMKNTCDLINKTENVFEKAFLAILMIAYIQPFSDGNKRTSRLTGNALLLANNACPLSYRSIDETDYKKAVLIFYEQNNISNFKKLFIDQFDFVVNNYFL